MVTKVEYRHVYMRREPSLILDGAIIMGQLPKHALFEDSFNDRLDHVMKVLDYRQRIPQQHSHTISNGVFLGNEVVDVNFGSSIKEGQRRMSVSRVDRQVNDWTSMIDERGFELCEHV